MADHEHKFQEEDVWTLVFPGEAEGDEPEEVDYVIEALMDIDEHEYVFLVPIDEEESDAEGNLHCLIMRVDRTGPKVCLDPIDDKLEFMRVLRAREEELGMPPGTMMTEDDMEDMDFQRKVLSVEEADKLPAPARPGEVIVDLTLGLDELSAVGFGLAAYAGRNAGAIAAGMIPGVQTTRVTVNSLLLKYGALPAAEAPVTVFAIESYAPNVRTATDLTEEERAHLLTHNLRSPSVLTGPDLAEVVDVPTYIDILKAELVRAYLAEEGIPLMKTTDEQASPRMVQIAEAVMGFELPEAP